MREHSGTNESGNRSINISGLLWLLLCGLIAALIAGFLLLVLVLITPQDATTPAALSTPARMVTSYWEGDLLMVQCAGFQPGDNVVIFITPSMAEVNSTREGIAVLQAGPQGNCPSGGVRVDAGTAMREGWQLVVVGSRAGDIASTPFIAMPVAAQSSQPRQAIPAQVQPAAPETMPPQSTGQYQESLNSPSPQNVPLQQPPPPNPGDSPTDTPYDFNNEPCSSRANRGRLQYDIWCAEYYRDRDQDAYPIHVVEFPPTRRTSNEEMLYWSGVDWPSGYAGDMPRSNFRIVFTGTFNFPETRSYLFTLRLNGSARIKIGDQPQIDAYTVGSKRPGTYRVSINKGYHPVRLEYYLDGGTPNIYLAWTPDGNRNDYWLGRYYNNPTMDAPVSMIRQDEKLDFSWDASPGNGMQADNFSVQWLRVFQVPRNGMTCSMTADDKVRVYVDGRLIPELSNWDAPNAWDKTVTLNAGRRFVEVHFVEQGGLASIHFNCNPIVPAY